MAIHPFTETEHSWSGWEVIVREGFAGTDFGKCRAREAKAGLTAFLDVGEVQ